MRECEKDRNSRVEACFFLIFFSAINQEMKSVGLEKEEGAEEILGSENFGIDGRFPMVGRRPHAGHHRVPS